MEFQAEQNGGEQPVSSYGRRVGLAGYHDARVLLRHTPLMAVGMPRRRYREGPQLSARLTDRCWC